jgi:hypothetical protein
MSLKRLTEALASIDNRVLSIKRARTYEGNRSSLITKARWLKAKTCLKGAILFFGKEIKPQMGLKADF